MRTVVREMKVTAHWVSGGKRFAWGSNRGDQLKREHFDVFDVLGDDNERGEVR